MLWQYWLEKGTEVLVRAAQQIARQLPLKHRGKLRRGHEETVPFGISRVHLPDHPDTPLWMIVVLHGKQAPLVLVTTPPVRGRRQGERMIPSYLDRWACEEGYRFSKQGFDLEGVQARRFTTLQNLVALATLAWGLLAVHRGAERLPFWRPWTGRQDGRSTLAS